MSDPVDKRLAHAVQIARIALAFGRVERATRHDDGVRPETDADHTVMLGLLAYDLAPSYLDAQLVASFALVHDLVEVYAGDTQTLTASPDVYAAKRAREDKARERLAADLGRDSRIPTLIARYEAQQEPEARFVRLLDKVVPKLTHALNGCAGALPLVDEAGFVRAHERQLQQLQAEYPEFPETLGLLRASMLHAESCWPTLCAAPAAVAPAAEVPRLRDEREALYLAVGNLLAAIHRDGGHHMAEHGVKASCAAAERVVCDERARLDAVEHAARAYRDATDVLIGAWTERDGTRAEHWIAADRSRREAADAQAQARVVLDRVLGGSR